MLQWYGKVPLLLNTRENVPPGGTIPESHTSVSEVLVWLVLDVVFRQTTFVPGAMVMVAGRNAKFTIFTVWEAAGESLCAILASETPGKASRGRAATVSTAIIRFIAAHPFLARDNCVPDAQNSPLGNRAETITNTAMGATSARQPRPDTDRRTESHSSISGALRPSDFSGLKGES
jgi:hypothetical protein